MTQNNFNNSMETGIIKKYEDLTISDDFMFGIIMRQAKYCKPFWETVLDIKIKHIEYPKVQEVINLDVKAKSIRLDVYVTTEKTLSIILKCKISLNRISRNACDIIRI